MSDRSANADFLLAAIADTEGTVRAIDTKASIALVVHGLLFSALVGVTTEIGGVYAHAACGLRVAVAVLLGATAASLVASVLLLLRCVSPSPPNAIPDVVPLAASSHFFPSMTATGIDPRVRSIDANAFRDAVASMTEEERFEQLAGELLKLSAIRARKIALIRRGLGCLAVEFLAAIAYLLVLAVHAT